MRSSGAPLPPQCGTNGARFLRSTTSWMGPCKRDGNKGVGPVGKLHKEHTQHNTIHYNTTHTTHTTPWWLREKTKVHMAPNPENSKSQANVTQKCYFFVALWSGPLASQNSGSTLRPSVLHDRVSLWMPIAVPFPCMAPFRTIPLSHNPIAPEWRSRWLSLSHQGHYKQNCHAQSVTL